MAAAVDLFPGMGGDLQSPVTHAVAVTPSDSVPLAFVSRKLFVGGAGSVTAVMQDGTTVTYGAVPAGTYLNIRVSQVKATGTTATSIVSEY